MGGATLSDINKKKPSDLVSVCVCVCVCVCVYVYVYVHGVMWSQHQWRKLRKVRQTGNQSDRKSDWQEVRVVSLCVCERERGSLAWLLYAGPTDTLSMNE